MLTWEILISLSVACTSVVFGLGVAYLCRHTLGAAFRDFSARCSPKSRARAIEAMDQLKAELREFRGNLSLLDEYAPEYHISFTCGGWGWLTSTAEHLSVAEHIVDAFWAAGRYQDAYTLASLVNGTLPHAEMPLAAMRFADFVDLLDWKARSHQQVLKLLEVVHESAAINKDIGVERTRKRKPTIHALSELKRNLEG